MRILLIKARVKENFGLGSRTFVMTVNTKLQKNKQEEEESIHEFNLVRSMWPTSTSRQRIFLIQQRKRLQSSTMLQWPTTHLTPKHILFFWCSLQRVTKMDLVHRVTKLDLSSLPYTSSGDLPFSSLIFHLQEIWVGL